MGADQFGVAVGLVRGGLLQRPHLMQGDRDTGLGELPGSFGTGQAAADDVNGFQAHEAKLGAGPARGNRRPKTKTPAASAGGFQALIRTFSGA